MYVGLQAQGVKMETNAKMWLFFEIRNSRAELYLKESVTGFISNNQPCFYSEGFTKPVYQYIVYGCNNREFPLPLDVLELKGNVVLHQCCVKNTTELQKDFKSSMLSFTDVVIEMSDGIIHAHKFVLCARSPVFKKMFEQAVKESNARRLIIPEIEKSVINEFLIFLYTEIVEETKLDTVMGLYSLADKFEVKSLQETCRGFLVDLISTTTVSQILGLADFYEDNDLKETAIQFICNNFTDVEITEEWEELLDIEPRLASYTVRRVATSISKN